MQFLIFLVVLLTISSGCEFPVPNEENLCDSGFMAINPQRFVGSKGSDKMMLISDSEAEGKWYYQSRENPGRKPRKVQRVVKSAEWQSEDSGVKGDAFRFTHTLTAEEFLPGRIFNVIFNVISGVYKFVGDDGKSCSFYVY
eukprot:sb/3474236/